MSRRDQRGVHAVLLLLSYWILRSMPGPGAAETTLKAFYGGADRRRVLAVGLYLLPFAAIAFVWFIVALRMWVGSHGRPEHALFSNVQLVSGILFIALLLEAAAAFRSTLRWWSSPSPAHPRLPDMGPGLVCPAAGARSPPPA